MRNFALSAVVMLSGCNLFSATDLDDVGRDVKHADVMLVDMDGDAGLGGPDVLSAGDARLDSDLALDANMDADLDEAQPPEPVLAYDFSTIVGTTVPDVTAPPRYDLTIVGDVTLVRGAAAISGTFAAGALETGVAPTDFYTEVAASGQFAVSLWIEVASLDLGDPLDSDINGLILTFSRDSGLRNFTLAQWRDVMMLRVRTSETTTNGLASVLVADAFEFGVHHHFVQVVDGRFEYYINGELRAQDGPGGTLDGWDDTYRLRLGDEFDGGRQWRGALHDVRVWSRALTPELIMQLATSGPP